MEGSGVTATERSDRPLPPRRRPKLKPFSIVCALPDCGLVKVRYYPRRPSVAARANRGGRTYCSKAHAQRDWERRRRHEAAETTTCAWRGCAHEIPPTHRPGRPRSYCSDRCKAAAARDRARPIPNALATAQAQAATAREKAAPARREADAFRGRLDATEAAAKAAARYPARLLAWEQAEPKPPGPRVFPPRHPMLLAAWSGRIDSRPPSEIRGGVRCRNPPVGGRGAPAPRCAGAVRGRPRTMAGSQAHPISPARGGGAAGLARAARRPREGRRRRRGRPRAGGSSGRARPEAAREARGRRQGTPGQGTQCRRPGRPLSPAEARVHPCGGGARTRGAGKAEDGQRGGWRLYGARR